MAKPDGPFVLPDIDRVEHLVARVFERYPMLRIDIDGNGVEPSELGHMTRAALRHIGRFTA